VDAPSSELDATVRGVAVSRNAEVARRASRLGLRSWSVLRAVDTPMGQLPDSRQDGSPLGVWCPYGLAMSVMAVFGP
jgi:hypothetical protein